MRNKIALAASLLILAAAVPVLAWRVTHAGPAFNGADALAVMPMARFSQEGIAVTLESPTGGISQSQAEAIAVKNAIDNNGVTVRGTLFAHVVEASGTRTCDCWVVSLDGDTFNPPINYSVVFVRATDGKVIDHDLGNDGVTPSMRAPAPFVSTSATTG